MSLGEEMNHIVEHFEKHGYAPLFVVRNGTALETHRLRLPFEKVMSNIATLCNAGCNVELVMSTNEDSFFIHAVDPRRKGEGDMPTSLPTFKDFVADEIAKFVEIRTAQLAGDENPTYVLQQLREQIADGTWQHYSDVTVEEMRRRKRIHEDV